MNELHTRGPLAYDGNGRIDAVEFRKRTDGGYMEGLIALPYPCGTVGDPAWKPAENGAANARRLVACWNACLGVPTEVLESWGQSGVQPSRRAFQRARHDARLARFFRAEANRALTDSDRARLIRSARKCEARVRQMADRALRGER